MGYPTYGTRAVTDVVSCWLDTVRCPGLESCGLDTHHCLAVPAEATARTVRPVFTYAIYGTVQRSDYLP